MREGIWEQSTQLRRAGTPAPVATAPASHQQPQSKPRVWGGGLELGDCKFQINHSSRDLPVPSEDGTDQGWQGSGRKGFRPGSVPWQSAVGWGEAGGGG